MNRVAEYYKNIGPMEDFGEYMEGDSNSKVFTITDDIAYDSEELMYELKKIINPYADEWGRDQIHISNVPGHEDNTKYSYGSLFVDHTKSTIDNLHFYDKPIKEESFSSISTIFKGTIFETIHSELSAKHNIGRFRVMTARAGGCLTWHHDTQQRLHYPIETQKGCFMVVGNEMRHLKQGKCYMVDTTIHHTAVNASRKHRIHLVANVLS